MEPPLNFLVCSVEIFQSSRHSIDTKFRQAMSLVLEDPASIDVVEAELVSKANSLIAHLEALVVTLEHRKPVKNNSVMGIHVSEDHEDDDEEAEADEDGEKDPGATEKLDDDSSEMPRYNNTYFSYWVCLLQALGQT